MSDVGNRTASNKTWFIGFGFCHCITRCLFHEVIGTAEQRRCRNLAVEQQFHPVGKQAGEKDRLISCRFMKWLKRLNRRVVAPDW